MQNQDRTQKLCLTCKGQLNTETITNTDLEQNLEPKKMLFFFLKKVKQQQQEQLGVRGSEAEARVKENKASWCV